MLTIRISDGLCSIKPWVSELKKPLSFKKSVYKLPGDYRAEVKEAVQKGKNPNSVKRYEYQIEELFSVDKDIGYFLPGALSLVREKLKELGLTWVEEDNRDPALYPEPVWQNCSDLRNEDQLTILASIVSAQGGIVKGCTGVGKSFIIRQLCKMFPTLNILVVTRRASVVKQLAVDIAKELPDEVSQVGAGGHGGGTRVIVSTTKSLHKISPDAVQLLLFDEAHAVGDQRTQLLYLKVS